MQHDAGISVFGAVVAEKPAVIGLAGVGVENDAVMIAEHADGFGLVGARADVEPEGEVVAVAGVPRGPCVEFAVRIVWVFKGCGLFFCFFPAFLSEFYRFLELA